jgi:hypothetical protein
MKLCILMGSLELSGGAAVILEHARYLQQHGVDTVIVARQIAQARSRLWHPAFANLTFMSPDEAAKERFDLALATWWETAYWLPFISATQYAVLIQRIEHLLYTGINPDLAMLAEATYREPIPSIVISDSMKEFIEREYGRRVLSVPNGIHKATFTEAGPAIAPRKPGRLRILVEGPLGVDFKNVARSIHLAGRSRADEIWLLTASKIGWYPGVDRVFSRIPVTQCANIYRSCDVLLKLSTLEGFSLPILEMFHCGGTAVCFDIPGPNDFVRNNENSCVLPVGDEAGVVAAINRLREDADLLDRLKSGARQTAAEWPDWSASSAKFREALHEVMRGPKMSRQLLGELKKRHQQYAQRESIEEWPLLVQSGAGAGLTPVRAAMRQLAAHVPMAHGIYNAIRGRLKDGGRPCASRTPGGRWSRLPAEPTPTRSGDTSPKPAG